MHVATPDLSPSRRAPRPHSRDAQGVGRVLLALPRRRVKNKNMRSEMVWLDSRSSRYSARPSRSSA